MYSNRSGASKSAASLQSTTPDEESVLLADDNTKVEL